MTGIGYWWLGGILQNSHQYSYDPAGNVVVCNQGYYSTAYAYNGADQLVSETNTGGNYTPSLAYTYDHNGNRLTQTSNGSQVQSFTYDAHDKLTSGTAGNETDTYDANGSETRVSIFGGVYQLTYDDEDRLVGETLPSGQVDTFVYNGLGLRVGKTDSTGTYAYVCDGASPGSPVLSDGHALYTPGLSESRGGVSRYNSFDRLGNLWFVDNAAASQSYYQDTTGFGTSLGASGTDLSAFGYGGGNGCQTDADTGVVLMGHRYYDTRIGRFISQDPVQAGSNWYSYAGNNPTNNTDPTGLITQEQGDEEYDNLINSSHYDGETISWDANNQPSYKDANGVICSASYNITLGDSSGGDNALTGMFSQHSNDPMNFADKFLMFGATSVVTDGLGDIALLAGAGRTAEEAGAAENLVIGKLGELKSVGNGERTLLPKLQNDLGSPKLNWKQNSGALRDEMRLGNPIRDAHVDPITGELIPEDYNSFLNAERNLLSSKGWDYNSKTTFWSP